jgi:hypothetical protein
MQGGLQHPGRVVERDSGCHGALKAVSRQPRSANRCHRVDVDADVVAGPRGIPDGVVERVELDSEVPVRAGRYVYSVLC